MVISSELGVLMQLPQWPVVLVPAFFNDWLRILAYSRCCCLHTMTLLRTTCTEIAVDFQLILNGSKFLFMRLRVIEPHVRREGTLWRAYRMAVWTKAWEANRAAKRARLLT